MIWLSMLIGFLLCVCYYQRDLIKRERKISETWREVACRWKDLSVDQQSEIRQWKEFGKNVYENKKAPALNENHLN